MARHDGYIYEKNGAFHVRFYQTDMRDGEIARVRKSKKFATMAELRKKNPRVTVKSDVVKDLARDASVAAPACRPARNAKPTVASR